VGKKEAKHFLPLDKKRGAPGGKRGGKKPARKKTIKGQQNNHQTMKRTVL